MIFNAPSQSFLRSHSIGSREELRRFVTSSSGDGEEIYRTWFERAPRHYFRAVDRRFGITQGTVCDIGCGAGANLLFCPQGSYGIEVDSRLAAFGQGLGLSVFEADVLSIETGHLPAVETVWCSAVLEHVDSPHILLRKAYELLAGRGLLCIYVPVIPAFARWPLPRSLRSRWFGFIAEDHVNAFVPATLRFTCERAGFETLAITPMVPLAGSLGNLAIRNLNLAPGCMYVGRKIPDWRYTAKCSRFGQEHSGAGMGADPDRMDCEPAFQRAGRLQHP